MPGERLLKIKTRIGRLRLLGRTFKKGLRLCRCCGDPIEGWGLCGECASFTGVMIRAHESSRRRSLFG